MHNRIDEQKCVASFHMDFNRALYAVSRLLRAADRVRPQLGVLEVRFMTTGDHHGGTVARSDVRQRHQDIDLTALEMPIIIPELSALNARMSARMKTDSAARAAYIGEIFIDKKR